MKNKNLLIVCLMGLVFGVFAQIGAVDTKLRISNKTSHNLVLSVFYKDPKPNEPQAVHMPIIKPKTEYSVEVAPEKMLQVAARLTLPRRAQYFDLMLEPLQDGQVVKLVVEDMDGKYELYKAD